MAGRRTRALVCATAILGVLSAAAGSATPVQRRAYMTFRSPVELPGIILTAGTYVFERADGDEHAQNVIVVRSRNRSIPHFIGITVPVARPWTLQTGSVVVFGKARRGQPRPIAEWYADGAFTGHRFIY